MAETKREELNKALDEYDIKVAALNTAVFVAIKKLTKIGYKLQEAVKIAYATTNYEAKLTKIVLDGVVETMEVRVDVVEPIKVKRWYKDLVWDKSQVKFDETITKNIKLLKKEIKTQIRVGNDWVRTANKIKKTGDVQAKLPKYLKELVKKSKAANKLSFGITGSETRATKEAYLKAVRDYKREAERALKKISKLASNDAPTTLLKKAYDNLVKQTDTMNLKAIEKGLERTIRNKAKYYAQRISRTELARANAIAVQFEIDQDEDIYAWKSTLNTRHEIVDICDMWAKADLFGLGPGVAPRRVDIQIPYHSFCFCRIIKIYKNVGKGEFSIKRGIKFLDDNPSIKKSLINKKDMQSYEGSKNSWTKLVKGWKPFQAIPRPPNGTVALI